MSSPHKYGQESGYSACNAVAATFPQIFWAFPPSFQIYRTRPPLLSFLKGSSSCWDANLRYASHVRKDFHPRAPSMCFLPMGPYAGPLLCTGNLLGQFIVLEQTHGPTYYFGPLPPQQPLKTPVSPYHSRRESGFLPFLKDKFE